MLFLYNSTVFISKFLLLSYTHSMLENIAVHEGTETNGRSTQHHVINENTCLPQQYPKHGKKYSCNLKYYCEIKEDGKKLFCLLNIIIKVQGGRTKGIQFGFIIA